MRWYNDFAEQQWRRFDDGSHCDVDTSAKGSATVVAGPPTLVVHSSMHNGLVEFLDVATFLAHYMYRIKKNNIIWAVVETSINS